MPHETDLTLLEQDFALALAAIPRGYAAGVCEGLRYGVTWRDGKRTSLLARALAGGDDDVSFNLYRLRSGEDSLRPGEMLAEKVVAFVLGYASDPLWA